MNQSQRLLKGVVLALMASFSFAEENGASWDAYYYIIRKCIESEYETMIFSYALIKDEAHLEEFLLKKFRPGYFVLVDTNDMTSSQACQVSYVAKKFFGEGTYLPNAEKVVVGVYPTKADAENMASKIKEVLRWASPYVKHIKR